MSNPNYPSQAQNDARYSKPADVAAAISTQAAADAGQYAKNSVRGRTTFGTLSAPIITGPASHPASLSAVTAYTYQSIHQLFAATPQIRLVFTNFGLPGSNNLTPEGVGTGTWTLKAGLIWNYGQASAILIPVTFNNVRTLTVGSIGIGEVWTSDPIDVPPSIISGSWFVVRSYVTTSTTSIPLSRTPWSGNTPAITEGSAPGDYSDSAGNSSWGNATNDGTNFGPTAVIGWGQDGLNRTTLITGDSIAQGTGTQLTSGSLSFIAYALFQAKIGAVNLAHSGEQLGTVLSAYANQRMRLTMAYGCVNAICEYGTNDLYASPFYTTSQMKTALLTYWAQLKSKGCSVFQTTISPQTNSTDNWQTINGQTSKNTTAESYRQQINQWLRAPLSAGAGNSALFDAGGTLTAVYDSSRFIEVNADGSAITINGSTGGILNGAGGLWRTDTMQYEAGTVSSSTSQKITDSSKSWVASQWLDYAMVITGDSTTPASVGQVRIISASNTSGQLNTDISWTTTPSVGATYKIIKVYTTDGTHPTTFGHRSMSTAIDSTKLTAV